ncbi:hypothetical protein L228DRAFT_15037 [Xylona heveae TC161]|uniref:Uncharacterized protein n=1 Tax=Xylona heveae (strain CBS 132557 / TC161) TaxID=1328760 RepID=A0A165JSC5_XYLHT|nr:hypothetical protein L228DRAFT_15037 [Xylona heveae TC161]KZF26567.1 hypothetical protein L228DRAFT_15037 [Xylona heveae TC161]
MICSDKSALLICNRDTPALPLPLPLPSTSYQYYTFNFAKRPAYLLTSYHALFFYSRSLAGPVWLQLCRQRRRRRRPSARAPYAGRVDIFDPRILDQTLVGPHPQHHVRRSFIDDAICI